MKSIRDFATKPMTWTQPTLVRRNYELRAGPDVLAKLHWQMPWGSQAIAETINGAWMFKRDGWFSPNVMICDSLKKTANWTLNVKWGEGTFDHPSGYSYQWQRLSAGQGEWKFKSISRQPLIEFTLKPAAFRYESKMQIDVSAPDILELPLLATLGWYIMILRDDFVVKSATKEVTTN
jgi:hypothetical protein